MQSKPLAMLVILDGWGWRTEAADNAVAMARTPAFDKLWASCPHALLKTSGQDVGLPDGQMGNSEVGHLNIGAGRVVMQSLPQIDHAVATGSIAQTEALQTLIGKLRATGGTCHVAGLLSPGGIHAHMAHASGVIQILHAAGIPVVVHVWADGRDTPPQSGAAYLAEFMATLPTGVRIGSISGRYFAMDRDKRWERVTQAYHAMVAGQGQTFASAQAVFEAAYAQGTGDEFILPATLEGYQGMNDGDGLFCFNFRADRVREILGALLEPDFAGFERTRCPKLAAVVGMTQYSEALAPLMLTAFPPQSLAHGLGQVVAEAGLTQLRMAESEKYPHVTYFLNGGEERQYTGEERILVASPKVATYDLQPEMSAPELTEKAVEAIRSGKYNLIVLNFANPDMVGHTGVIEAAIKAVETVDTGLGRIAEAVAERGGQLLVTADHGNCELMRDPATGGPHTAHTIHPVPVMLMGAKPGTQLAEGRLADIAPTLLAVLGIAQPQAMSGQSLLRTA